MKFNIITLFPEFFAGPLGTGLMQRAVEKGIVNFNLVNPRDFADDKRGTVDDRPYGGGPGMVMLLQPLVRALRSLGQDGPGQAGHGSERGPVQGPGLGRILAMSPKGRPFNQQFAAELGAEEQLTIICGRYEGYDARLADLFPLEEVSLGDFVLNGGETASLSICEAVSRLLPGFMGHEESGTEESFSANLLEYPHYTRPEEFEGLGVPQILRSGDHAGIAAWRRQEALRATLKTRPDLLEHAALGPADLEFIKSIPRLLRGRNLHLALLHHPVLGKDKKTTAVSLTNLDIHDIARSSSTYGLGSFLVVTPLEDQLFILDKVLEHWTRGPGAGSNPDRRAALSKVVACRSLDEALDAVEKKHGERPLVWGSSADFRANMPAGRGRGRKKIELPPGISFDEAGKILYTRPAVLLLGTSHGLAPEVIMRCDHLLPPLRAFADYNHLSVRCAGTVLLDRILGEWG